MNGIWGHVTGIVIVVLMLVFIGIWVWVWRPRHKRKFERLSKLPLEDSKADGPEGRTMSTFWSTWVIVLAVVTFGISFLLLCWAPWVKIPTQADGTTTHVWAHGVLREGVKDLPRWWLVVSFLAFFAAALYVLLFPGLGNYRGLLNWTSDRGAGEEAAARNDALMAALLQRTREQPVEQLAADPDASAHRPAAVRRQLRRLPRPRGAGDAALGAPNLLDADWLYGGDGEGDPDQHPGRAPGRDAGVRRDHRCQPASATSAHYVAGLSGEPRDAVKAALGKPLFQACAACHGADRQGQSRPGRAQPDRPHLALRRLARRHRADDPRRPQRRDAGVAGPAGRGRCQARRCLGLWQCQRHQPFAIELPDRQRRGRCRRRG